VLAEVEPFPGDEPIRGITFSFVAMDWVLVGVLLATGTLVFVIGVRLLGSGFLLLTSPQAHLPTGPWAESRPRGYLGGGIAGAIFESSSLVTSHLASFANGGLLTASAALGMILGANLGGTALPQILSLGIGSLAAPFLLVGTVLFLLPRKAGMNAWAWACLGAGLILTGWSLLDHAAELTSLSREFKTDVLFGEADPAAPFGRYASRFLAYFSLAAGLAFVLRTSNLLVVLAMLLAAHGIVGAPTCIPMVLGANVGSAAMVFTLSLRKRREARRIALTNLVFQGLGCLGALALSLLTVDGRSLFSLAIDVVSPHRVLGGPSENLAHQVANAHTFFNLLAGLPFLFFPRGLLGIVDRLIPPGTRTQDDIKPYLLDHHLIPVPALALRQAAHEVIYMTQVSRKTIAEAYDSFRYSDLDLSEQVVRREEVLSGLHRDVVNYLVEVCENQLSRRDAVQMEVLVTAVNSLARIGQLGERLRELTARKIEEGTAPTEEMDRDLNEVYDLVMAQFANILVLLEERDPKTEENAVKMVERLAKFSSRIETQWRQRLETAEGPKSPMAIYVQTIIYQEAFGILFDIASHLAHIAQQMRILSPSRV
jgi:phosphate:Na+ symporter